MSKHHLDRLKRIRRSMKRWESFWWWDIMRNYSEALEVRSAIQAWIEDLDAVIAEIEP